MAVAETKSIGEQISRLQSAKDAIKAALEGKGVTVPDTALLGAYAKLIEGIEAGDGLTWIQVDEFTATQTYDQGDSALGFITGIVDSNAFVNLFVDKQLVVAGDSPGIYCFTACAFFPSFVSDKWKASRHKQGDYGANSGTSMPSINAGRTIYRLAFKAKE